MMLVPSECPQPRAHHAAHSWADEDEFREPEEWAREAALCEEGAALKARGNELFSAKDFGGAACVPRSA